MSNYTVNVEHHPEHPEPIVHVQVSDSNVPQEKLARLISDATRAALDAKEPLRLTLNVNGTAMTGEDLAHAVQKGILNLRRRDDGYGQAVA